MALRYRYKLVSMGHPVVSLGGRWVRPRPIVGVTLIGPKDSRYREGPLDSAADDTVFPERLAGQIGVDLTNAPTGIAQVVGGMKVSLRYAQVSLRITDGHELREWPAWVGFSPAVGRPLLGFAGFLQFFQADFHGDLEFVELQVNQLYPGS